MHSLASRPQVRVAGDVAEVSHSHQAKMLQLCHPECQKRTDQHLCGLATLLYVEVEGCWVGCSSGNRVLAKAVEMA